MTGQSSVRFQAADIFDAPDDDRRYEVIDGELCMSPSPSWKHQRVLHRLDMQVSAFVVRNNLGEVVEAPLGVVLDAATAVQPDLVYVSHARAHLISERGIEGAPDLVVEVLSPSTRARDRGIKLRRYAAAGVPHYWLLDPDAPALEAYVLGATGYELAGVYGPGSTFQPALFPGLAIVMDEIWGA